MFSRVTVILALLMLADSTSWLKIKRLNGWKEYTQRQYLTRGETHVVDRAMCEWQCMQTFNCRGITYNSETLYCRGFFTNVVLSKVDGPYQVSLVKTMDVYLMHNYANISLWTTQKASELCESVGFTLMSLLELQILNQNGFDFNSCGLVAENVSVMSLTNTRYWTNTTGVIPCFPESAYAYCRP